MATKETIREIMSEPGLNGTLSWGRIASSVALAAAIGWGCWLVHLHQPIPFKEMGEFVISPYGANKLSTAIQAFSKNPVVEPPK